MRKVSRYDHEAHADRGNALPALAQPYSLTPDELAAVNVALARQPPDHAAIARISDAARARARRDCECQDAPDPDQLRALASSIWDAESHQFRISDVTTVKLTASQRAGLVRAIVELDNDDADHYDGKDDLYVAAIAACAYRRADARAGKSTRPVPATTPSPTTTRATPRKASTRIRDDERQAERDMTNALQSAHRRSRKTK